MVEKPELKNTMALWDKVCVSDPKYTKPVSYGARKFTAINAMYQIEQATEIWGAYGNWGLRNCRFNIVELKDGKLLTLEAEFFYPQGDKEISFEIANDIPMSLTGEVYKKIVTDALTKALSRLGWNADIFKGDWDDNRYVDEEPIGKPKVVMPKATNTKTETKGREQSEQTKIVNGSLKAKRIGVIKILQRKLEEYGFSSEDYQNQLKQFGVHSATQLNEAQLQQLINNLNDLLKEIEGK